MEGVGLIASIFLDYPSLPDIGRLPLTPLSPLVYIHVILLLLTNFIAWFGYTLL